MINPSNKTRPLDRSVMPLRCWFFGHTGTNTESGYHVCSRCGLHEYHGWPDYQRAGLLFNPWWSFKAAIRRSFNRIRSRWKTWRQNPHDDVPF